ncbi:MAG: acyl-CoA reductase, partial [Tannerella sp.]|nr:acyl-CoA reductase [Tannerella sp.]
MRNFADVAIRMQQSFNDIELLFPAAIDWEDWRRRQKPCEPFSDSVIAFLNALSVSLMKDTNSRTYPDVVTFAFFCRKHQLLTLKHQYQTDELRLGRGTVFHVAPSNVPVNFAYSLIAGLLSGNNNIVRVSSKEFPQVDLIVKHLYELSKNEEFSGIIHRIVLIRYDRNSNATGYFSSFCNVRVIWGGNETITQIRRNPLPSRSFDVTFADRYSLAVINADVLIQETNLQKIAEGFYNDTYFFDQNACSAPHLIIWTGDTA